MKHRSVTQSMNKKTTHHTEQAKEVNKYDRGI